MSLVFVDGATRSVARLLPTGDARPHPADGTNHMHKGATDRPPSTHRCLCQAITVSCGDDVHRTNEKRPIKIAAPDENLHEKGKLDPMIWGVDIPRGASRETTGDLMPKLMWPWRRWNLIGR
ncbi:hypothetical protein E2C01_074884 [Portunus trituberculatus]|uniref:Uncharacterized protein n=1 Tax=Portunus trituberculatus TaxID=210409 RepID=A0A5B7IEB6_PORTR|nr:hypothetical protein [Portunus trituberculatus]